MSTLYKRATPAQARVLRIVAGAVKNAADGHPEIVIPHNFARSVAKRAAGTLTAQWPDVLAAGAAPLSDRREVSPRKATRRRCALHRLKGVEGAADVGTSRRQPPYQALLTRIGRMIAAAERAGNESQRQALIEIVKFAAERKAAFVPVDSPAAPNGVGRGSDARILE